VPAGAEGQRGSYREGTRMKRILIQLAQAILAAAIIGAPIFYYFLFVMTP
jgi:hypothetical protein